MDSVVRVSPPQPASPVSVGHVRFTKIGAVFPRVSEGVAESLWPNFLNFGRHLLSPRVFFGVSFLMCSWLNSISRRTRASCSLRARRYARSGASSVAERARSDQLPARGARGFRRGPLERIFPPVEWRAPPATGWRCHSWCRKAEVELKLASALIVFSACPRFESSDPP